jgi:beta-N-acetylhexosaminidase
MGEMVSIASTVGEISPASRARRARAMATIDRDLPPLAYEDLAAKRDALLSYA